MAGAATGVNPLNPQVIRVRFYADKLRTSDKLPLDLSEPANVHASATCCTRVQHVGRVRHVALDPSCMVPSDPSVLRVGSYRLFQFPDLELSSPESGDLWYTGLQWYLAPKKKKPLGPP